MNKNCGSYSPSLYIYSTQPLEKFYYFMIYVKKSQNTGPRNNTCTYELCMSTLEDLHFSLLPIHESAHGMAAEDFFLFFENRIVAKDFFLENKFEIYKHT